MMRSRRGSCTARQTQLMRVAQWVQRLMQTMRVLTMPPMLPERLKKTVAVMTASVNTTKLQMDSQNLRPNERRGCGGGEGSTGCDAKCGLSVAGEARLAEESERLSGEERNETIFFEDTEKIVIYFLIFK